MPIKISQLTSLAAMTDAAIVPVVSSGVTYQISGSNLKTYFSSVTGNVTGGNLNTGGLVTATGNVNTASGVLATGNVSGGNITSPGVISATGNISGNYFIGNGSLLTGISGGSGYGNANVVSLLADFGSNSILTTGNATVGNLFGTNWVGNGFVSIAGYLNVGGGGFYVNANSVVSASGNVIFGTANAVPAFTTRSAGTKLVLYPQINAGNVDYAFGIEAGNLWQTVPQNSNNFGFKWYGGNTQIANLSGAGNMSVVGNVTAANFIGGGAGTPTLSSATNLDLSAVSAVRVIGGGTFRMPSLTTAQIANTIAANGDMIYNSSVNKFQGYENGAWANII